MSEDGPGAGILHKAGPAWPPRVSAPPRLTSRQTALVGLCVDGGSPHHGLALTVPGVQSMHQMAVLPQASGLPKAAASAQKLQ